MISTQPISCPLCGHNAESAIPIVPGGGPRPGMTAISCSGSCGCYLITSDLIGRIPPRIASALSRQAASRFERDPNDQLEITPVLLQTLSAP